MRRRNVRKQGWVFLLFSPDSKDWLILNFTGLLFYIISCDTQSVGFGQYCLPKVSNGFKQLYAIRAWDISVLPFVLLHLVVVLVLCLPQLPLFSPPAVSASAPPSTFLDKRLCQSKKKSLHKNLVHGVLWRSGCEHCNIVTVLDWWNKWLETRCLIGLLYMLSTTKVHGHATV